MLPCRIGVNKFVVSYFNTIHKKREKKGIVVIIQTIYIQIWTQAVRVNFYV